MIDHVDRPVERTYPAPPNDFSIELPGPEFVLLKKRLPPRMCAALRAREPGFIQRGELPKLERVVLETVATLERQHFGRNGANLSELKLMRYETGSFMREHRDNEHEGTVFPGRTEPTGLVPFAVQFYLSDPGVDYEGGAIVVGAARIQPALGSVVAVRGDALHYVETVTRGERSVVKALLSVPTDLAWCWRNGRWV